ncbi:unnamed protein product [Cochlearia groenlandica]
MKEDCGASAADCLVLCCCCECFMLQVFLFVFFKIPCKLAHKMKKLVTKRRLRRKMRRDAKRTFLHTKKDCREEEERFYGHETRSKCMEDIEEMLQELSMEGEFVFGSFWRHGDSTNEFDFGNSKYEIAKDSDHILSLLIAQDVLLDSRIQTRKSIKPKGYI